jgi:hypothetical protein
MATVLNADRAIVDPEKLRGYLLSSQHPLGRFKARFFASLGYGPNDATRLEHDLRRQLGRHAEVVDAGSHGRKYVIRGILKGPNGRAARLVSVWIIRPDEDRPRFVTAYPRSRV